MTEKLSRRDFLKVASLVAGSVALAACAPSVVGPVMPIPDGAPSSPTPTQPAPTETATKTATATETPSPIATPTETNTPVPTAEVAIALFDKYNVDPATYTLTEVDGVIVGTDNETGKEIFRDGRFEIYYSVELAKKDCEQTNFKSDKFGFISMEGDNYYDYFNYVDSLATDVGYGAINISISDVLIDGANNCWGFTEGDVLFYRDKTGWAHSVPIIHINDDIRMRLTH